MEKISRRMGTSHDIYIAEPALRPRARSIHARRRIGNGKSEHVIYLHNLTRMQELYRQQPMARRRDIRLNDNTIADTAEVLDLA
jgi:hypothetical protein